MKYLLVFIAVAFVDAIWTLYIKAIQENAPFRSAMTGTLIYLLGSYAILSYTESPVYLIPACLGAFIGTYLTTEFNRRKSDKSKAS